MTDGSPTKTDDDPPGVSLVRQLSAMLSGDGFHQCPDLVDLARMARDSFNAERLVITVDADGRVVMQVGPLRLFDSGPA